MFHHDRVLERHRGDDDSEDGPADGPNVGARGVERFGGFGRDCRVDGAGSSREGNGSAEADFLDEVLVQLHG